MTFRTRRQAPGGICSTANDMPRCLKTNMGIDQSPTSFSPPRLDSVLSPFSHLRPTSSSGL
jgi:hypothetical protein